MGYLVVLDCLEAVPEVLSIAHHIPSQCKVVQIEGVYVLFVSLFHCFQLLLGAHAIGLGERHDVGDMGLVIVECAVQLPSGVPASKLLSVAGELNVADWAHLHGLELKLQSHDS